MHTAPLQRVKPLRGRLRPEAKKVFAGGFVGTSLAVAFALFSPRWYQSHLVAVPSTLRTPALSVSSESLGGSADVDLSISDVERIAAIFRSSAVSTTVVARMGLLQRYGTTFLDRAQAELWSHCGITTDRKAKLITVTCEDQDPAFAQQLVSALSERTNEVLRSIGASTGGEEVRFLEKRVAEVQKEAELAAQKLREFEETNKVIDLDAQSRAVVSALSSLRGQQISKELELRYMRSFSSSDDASASQLRRQLGVIGNQFRSLEDLPDPPEGLGKEPRVSASAKAGAAPPRETKPGADMFPPALALPALQHEMSQHVRERNLSESSLVLLKQRLEMAKAAAAREMSAFQIVDPPSLPSSKYRPRGTVAVAVGLLLGLGAGFVWAFSSRYAGTVRRLLLRE